MQRSLDVSENLLKKWGTHSALYAFEPINEPWLETEIPLLKDFYRKVRKMVQRYAPQAYFVMHDSFRFNGEIWNDVFADNDIEKVALDTHFYTAFFPNAVNTVEDACKTYDGAMKTADGIKYEVWVGEWAIATDACATWLGGFNDGNTNFTVQGHQCNRVECPKSYMPDEFAFDFDRNAELLGPFGEGNPQDVCIMNGTCPTDSKHFDYDEVKTIARCALKAYDDHVDAHFLWTGHNQIEAKWDYVRAYDLGWLNQTKLPHDPKPETMYDVNPKY